MVAGPIEPCIDEANAKSSRLCAAKSITRNGRSSSMSIQRKLGLNSMQSKAATLPSRMDDVAQMKVPIPFAHMTSCIACRP